MADIDFELSVPQLRCFIAVVEAGSVAEAARRLGMSAASVSKAITRLEDGAGVRLLHRSTHAMSLTEDGEALVEPARAALHAARAFADAATTAGDRGDTGVVRITAAVGMSRNVLAPLVGELALLHPKIQLDLRATNEIVDLAEDGVDLAVRSGSLASIPGHLQQTWFTCPWVLCAAPAYLARRGVPTTVSELDGHDLIGFRNRRTGRVLSWPHRDGSYEVAPRFSFDDGDAVWRAMLAGAGIACAPLYVAAPALRAGLGVELLAPLRGADTTIALVRRDRRLTPGRLTTVMEFFSARVPGLDDLR